MSLLGLAVAGVIGGIYGVSAVLLTLCGGPRAPRGAAGPAASWPPPRLHETTAGQPLVYRYRPADTDNVVVMASRGPRCEGLAHHIAGFGLASVYTVDLSAMPLEGIERALQPVVEGVRAGSPGVPLATGSRPEVGPLSLRFLGGRYGQAPASPIEGAFIAPDGMALPTCTYAADATTVLVFIHGASSHGDAYGPLGQFLAMTGRATVVLPTLRGHHGTAGRPGDTATPGRLLEDLAALLGHLRQRHPGQRLVLGGHSTGGGLALRFANSPFASLVDGYLLIAPYLGPLASTTPVSTRGTWARPAPWRLLGLTMLGSPGSRLAGHLDAIHFDPPLEVRDGRETLAYSYRMLMALAPGWRGPRPSQQPMLVLVGERDEVFRASRYARALAGCRQAQLEVVPAATHLGVAFHPQAHALLARWLDAGAPVS